MERMREVFELPAPYLNENLKHRRATIMARPGVGMSAKEAAEKIALYCCPSCLLLKVDDPSSRGNAFCSGMDRKTETASLKVRKGGSYIKAKTEILLISKCAPKI